MGDIPKYHKFAFLINEDPVESKTDNTEEENFLEKLIQLEPVESEPQITRVGKLLAEKIELHSGERVDMISPDEILENSSETLAPVMYRIAIEGFLNVSHSFFKIIECRNITKLSLDWKPTLPQLLTKYGHQVILVDLKNEFVAYYNDFTYSIIRQLNYEWKERLPRSFFHPDDVCSVAIDSERHLIITPSLPDGELQFSEVKTKLEQNILAMLKNSCLTAMQNHLLLRDLRIGNLEDAMDGFDCIRQIYRELQRRIKSGEKVVLGTTHEALKLYMATKAGLTISSAESLLTACKILDIEKDIETTNDNWDKPDEDDDEVSTLKQPLPIEKWDSFNQLSRPSSQSTVNHHNQLIQDQTFSQFQNIVEDMERTILN